MGNSERGKDWVIALFLAALAVLLTPALQLWAGIDSPWFLPYVVWAVLVLLAFVAQRRADGD